MQSWLYLQRVSRGIPDIECYVREQVGLGDDQCIAGMKRLCILGWLIVALGGAQQDNPRMLSQVVRCGTNQVAHVFDK